MRGCRPAQRSAIRHGAIQLPEGGVTPYPAYLGEGNVLFAALSLAPPQRAKAAPDGLQPPR
ncbi:hypothetical protein, partial [Salmonella enterica]|uniref:hypothetical protein n=1 Tax=Salmonella enterica TaxID=28901 RepID=UPI001F357696